MGRIFTARFMVVIVVIFMASTALSYTLLSNQHPELDPNNDILIDKALGLSLDGYYKEAFDILEPLAAKDVTRAQLYLATAYYHGNGVKRDLPKALFLLLTLQDKNYEPGIVNTYLNLISSLRRD